MGVDYYACNVCGETFPDCGDYGWCTGCEEHLCEYCRAEMVDKYGEDFSEESIDDYGEGNPLECDCCTKTVVRDEAILEYLLETLGTTREDYIQIILDKRGIKV